jgi:hypothetical protein
MSVLPNISFEPVGRIFASNLYAGVFLILLVVSYPMTTMSTELPWSNTNGAAKTGGMTVYVWNSQQLLDELKIRFNFWKRFEVSGFNRLLLSLDGQQIKNLSFVEERADLLKFISEAVEKNIRVELLLGEPLWILPKYRGDLLHIIQQLQDFPFTGLHLDLEPNQLKETRYSNKYLLAHLLRTLQSVKTVSPWPVGLSIHPRYFDPRKNQICLGCALSNLEINEVILMIYVANPIRVAELSLPILRRFPKLSFSIAQSVEKILSKEESYAMGGHTKFQAQMKELRTAMIPAANFNTIVIQSWEDFLSLKP